MRRLNFGFMFLIVFISVNVFAGEIKEIQLKDGSIIHGEILSLADGIYTLKSVSIGTIKIEESKVYSIISIKVSMEQYEGIQKHMMSDKEILSIILALQNDPDIQSVLEDPILMEAVNKGDMEALVSSPKFMKLLNNPKIQDIRGKIIK